MPVQSKASMVYNKNTDIKIIFRQVVNKKRSLKNLHRQDLSELDCNI